MTPSQRFKTTLVNDDLTTNRPYKPLTSPKKSTAGRRNAGDLTSWHRGGGHKQKLRLIDFKRDKSGIPAKVVSIEYDPNRSARIALVSYADGEISSGDVHTRGSLCDNPPRKDLRRQACGEPSER